MTEDILYKWTVNNHKASYLNHLIPYFKMRKIEYWLNWINKQPESLWNWVFKKEWDNYVVDWKHPYIEWHTLKVGEKSKAIAPWVVSIATILEYFGINLKDIEAEFKWILQPEDKINLEKKEDRYVILKDGKEMVVLKEWNWELEIWDIQLTEYNKYLINCFNQENNKEGGITIQPKLPISPSVWEIFQQWEFRLVDNDIINHCQNENELNIWDIIIWKGEFKKDYPSSFIVEMAAQIGSLSAARILDPNNDEKWKILTMWSTKLKFLDTPQKEDIVFILKIEWKGKRDITIVFEAHQDNKKIAEGEIKWNIVPKKVLLR